MKKFSTKPMHLLFPVDVMEDGKSRLKESKSLDEALEFVKKHAPDYVRSKNRLLFPFVDSEARDFFFKYMALSIMESNEFKRKTGL